MMDLRAIPRWWLLTATSTTREMDLASPVLAGVATAGARPAPEETPTAFPGAEALVFRAAVGAAPEMRRFVVKPAGWKAGDRRPGLVFFFGGG
jgi:hypothetical protein